MHLCMASMQEKGDAAVCPFCGFDERTAADISGVFLPMGFVLNQRYVIGKALGQGGFGITYIGFDRVLNTRVAIKEYYPGSMAQRKPENPGVVPFTQNAGDYHKGKERFLEEARTLAKFSDHPGIVGVKDCFDRNGTAYMVMEYLDGSNLKEYIERRGGCVRAQEAIAILMPIMDALRAVHQTGMIHRDISPDNIFLTKNGQIKLIDFGAARHSIGGEKSLSVMLKPGYAPEEQYRSHGNQGPWTDVYALSATLYRMVTGKVPPDALERVLDDQLEIPEDLPEAMQNALRRGLAVRAENRVSSVEELQQILRGETMQFSSNEYTIGTASLSERAKPKKRPTESSGRSAVLIVVGAAGTICLILLIFLIYMLLNGGNRNVYTSDVLTEATVSAVPTEISTNRPFLTDAPPVVIPATEVPIVTRPPVPAKTPVPTVTEAPVDHSADIPLLENAVYNCLYGFTYAVNTGDTSQINLFVEEGTDYYQETVKVTQSFYQQGIQEEVLSYEILDIEWLDQN